MAREHLTYGHLDESNAQSYNSANATQTVKVKSKMARTTSLEPIYKFQPGIHGVSKQKYECEPVNSESNEINFKKKRNR